MTNEFQQIKPENAAENHSLEALLTSWINEYIARLVAMFSD